MANYKINNETKTITLNVPLSEMNEIERDIIQLYIGEKDYTPRAKQKGLTYDDMKKALKNKPELVELENKIKNKEKYPNIKKWFNELMK